MQDDLFWQLLLMIVRLVGTYALRQGAQAWNRKRQRRVSRGAGHQANFDR